MTSEPTTTEAPKATRLFRGRQCTIVKSVKNLATGAVYDLIEYTRQVTNRRDGSVSTEKLIRKMRRPGTGVAAPVKEVEVELIESPTT